MKPSFLGVLALIAGGVYLRTSTEDSDVTLGNLILAAGLASLVHTTPDLEVSKN